MRVDAAPVMPHLVWGNSDAPTIMTTDKGANIILARTPPAPEHAYIEQDGEIDSTAARELLSEQLRAM